MSEKTHILGVFFTYGVSLSTWQKQGMLSREVSLYTALQPKPFQKVYFFTYGKESPELVEEMAAQGIEVKRKQSTLPMFLYSLVLPFLYKKELKECTVYKTTQVFGSWTAVIATWLYRKPLVVRAGFALSTNLRSEGWFARFFARRIESVSLRVADQVMVTTENIKNYYQKFTQRITVIPNFVDIHLFAPTEKKKDQRVHLLFVGRLSLEKNIGNLLFAIKDMENVTLTLIGEGDTRRDLEDLALGARAEIRFVGSVPHEDLPRYFAAADIFVLPSLFEGHPKVIVEAMASGLPIVASDVRGINTLLEHGKTGLLTATSSQAIRFGIETLVNDPLKREALGKNARLEAEKEFSFEKIVTAEKALYQRYLV